MTRILYTALVLAGLSLAGPALAQTTDGDTPAEERVCDDFTGAVYGRCVAYCEAVDCETAWEASCDTLWAHLDDVLADHEILDCTPTSTCDRTACVDAYITDYEKCYSDTDIGLSDRFVRCIERTQTKFDRCLERAGCTTQ